MLRALLLGCGCFSLFGCVGVQVDRLSEETRFRGIQTAVDLAGVFRNQGSSPRGEWRPLMTDFLFPGRSFSEPPGEVRLGSATPSVFRCEAISHGEVVAVRDLVQGQDFRLVDGGVQLDRKLAEPILSEAGAGIGTESSLIRLTDTGDVVLTHRGGGVGLMLFVVPMAVTEVQDALFERIKDGEQEGV